MASKRKYEDTDPGVELKDTSKKRKKGFAVGHANLPDGTHRRKSSSPLTYEGYSH